jgi:hypothetical protein
MTEVNDQHENLTPEQEHERGYDSQPQMMDEVSEWEAEQVWDDYESEGTQ